MADAPNQVWSWDITKLAGLHKWTWFHLYVILDVYSRYAVGWLVAPRESDRLAHELINACATAEQIPAGQLTLHADRGRSAGHADDARQGDPEQEREARRDPDGDRKRDLIGLAGRVEEDERPEHEQHAAAHG